MLLLTGSRRGLTAAKALAPEVVNMELGLTGKRVLVSGGTRGIGRETVKRFLEEGALVGFCARSVEAVRATETEFSAIGSVVGTVLDIKDRDAIHQWVNAMAGEWGGLDILVSNASALAIEDTEFSWEQDYEVDLMGAVRMINASIRYLRQSDCAAVVAVSSVSGREKTFAIGPYSAIKAALIAYMSGMATRYAKEGIRFNTVSPGNTYGEQGVWQKIERENKKQFEEALRLNPTGKMGTPEQIANSILFLASKAASRISGTNLLIDGALTRGMQF